MPPKNLEETLENPFYHSLICRASEGLEGRAFADIQGATIWIVKDEARLEKARQSLAFFAPHKKIEILPAFDCLPYDHFSPSPLIAARRASCLARLSENDDLDPDLLILLSLSCAMQKLPPRQSMKKRGCQLKPAMKIDFEHLRMLLDELGYHNSDIVYNVAEYAFRGNIVDIFPPFGSDYPIRIDFFGDEIEEIRQFDPDSQRTIKSETLDLVEILPAHEMVLNDDTISHYQKAYREAFGIVRGDDALFQAISAQQRVKGMERFLPLFFPQLESIFDYAPNAHILLDDQLLNVIDDRWQIISNCYQGRVIEKEKILPKDRLYLARDDLEKILSKKNLMMLSPWLMGGLMEGITEEAEQEAMEGTMEGMRVQYDLKGRAAPDFTKARRDPQMSVIDEVKTLFQTSAKPVWLAYHSPLQKDRLRQIFPDMDFQDVKNINQALHLKKPLIALIALDIEQGIQSDDFIILCESDILGTRSYAGKSYKKRVKKRDLLMNMQSIQPNDLVVHSDHGIGRFIGLKRVQVSGAVHDCLSILYASDDKLFIPVENADLVSRYGASEEHIALDRLGGQIWSARKEKIKRKLWAMAGQLIDVAAKRQIAKSEPASPPIGFYEEFCAGFPFEETQDQNQAILDVMEDLKSGRIMDRLICGDVGFGKTEIALRAALISVASGKQVAVVVPTTLLSRQHFVNFSSRFKDFPIHIAQLSRLVKASEAQKVKKQLSRGEIDIIIGTHALLKPSVEFHNLGLVVIDEEQHFGVKDKERMKAMRADIHILTLTATPIPRTLQLALSGARDVSLIGDPPQGRQAAHNFIGAFDIATIKQALLREKARGGSSFFICPHIRDIDKVATLLTDKIPELSFSIAHGQMSPERLEEQISVFYEGASDILLSTNIVEAGLDITHANSLVVWNAHMFGLAQLHQLRGRVGRGAVRAFAYFTLPPHIALTKAAEKRLSALNRMNELGAGFSLASRDLDIRGAGNLLGDDQSGHIREIGFELYQKMLSQMVQKRSQTQNQNQKDQEPSLMDWTPRVKIAVAVLIPESYIPDMGLRLSFYRQIASLTNEENAKALQSEMADRFGVLPKQVEALFRIVALKIEAYRANIEVLDIGALGVKIRFWRNQFANPSALVHFIDEQKGSARLRSDHSLIIKRDWQDLEQQFSQTQQLVQLIADMNREKKS